MKRITRFTYNITGCTKKHCGACDQLSSMGNDPICNANGNVLEEDKRDALRSEQCIKGEVKRRKT